VFLADYSIRPALSEDSVLIQSMVRSARINPTGLDWHRFIVAVSPDGRVVACGQIKPHNDGSMELASIVVEPDFRGQGIARLVIEQLLIMNSPPLYLMCRSRLGDFYKRFGFRPLTIEEMPVYFRRMTRLAKVFSIFARDGESLLVMKCD
jgi:N-acetylglutamate synthase-like GNAT family acetyltransferase